MTNEEIEALVTAGRINYLLFFLFGWFLGFATAVFILTQILKYHK